MFEGDRTLILVVAGAGTILLLWLVRRMMRRTRQPRLHPRLQKYGGPDAQLARQRREEAAKIEVTSSSGSVAGYVVIRQIDTVAVDGFRRPEEALEGVKAAAAMKGGNAVVNLRQHRHPDGKISVTGDAVEVKKAAP